VEGEEAVDEMEEALDSLDSLGRTGRSAEWFVVAMVADMVVVMLDVAVLWSRSAARG
jgi:hypothetical protein